MTKILAITNQKGGVGKTTTSINLAASLAAAGRRVLLIDLDPQGNATMGSGVEKSTLTNTVYQTLLGSRKISSVRILATNGKYDLIPANRDLAGAEIEMVDLKQRETRLKESLKDIHNEYDYILMDCPPALNLLTLNGLCAAHSVMIPMQCEYYALEGLSDLVNTIKKVRSTFNPSLRIEDYYVLCLTLGIYSLNKSQINYNSTLETNYTKQLYQEMYGSQKHQVLASQLCTMTKCPRAHLHIKHWLKKCWKSLRN